MLLKDKRQCRGSLTALAVLVLTVLALLLAVEGKSSTKGSRAVVSSSRTTSRKQVDVDAIINAAGQKSRASGRPGKFVKVICPAGKSLLYKFRATTLVGNRGLVNSRKGSAGNAETQLYGSMILTCPSKSTTRKANEISGDNKKNVVLVSFLKAQFVQYQGKSRGLSGRKYRKLMTSSDITKDVNANPMLYVQSKSGHVQSLVFKQSETRYIRSIKKGLIRMLTTETRRDARSQTDGFGGKYYKNYSKRFSRGKFTKTRHTLSVFQRFSHDDFINTLPVNKRHIHYDASHLVKVSLKKNIVKHASMKIKLTFGPSSDVPRHHAFVAFDKLTKNSLRDKSPEQNSASDLETLFIGSMNLQKVRRNKSSLSEDIKETVVGLEKNGRGAKLGSEFAFENSFSVNKLDRQANNALKRKEFSPRFFYRLLRGAKSDPSLSMESNKILAALAKYSKLHPIKSASILLKEMSKGVNTLRKKKLDKNGKVFIKNYLESIQSLCATIKSSKVQEKLVKLSTTHPYLANNYIYASIVIAFPSQSSFSLLKTLKSKGLKAFARSGSKKYKISNEYNEEIKQNAFMSYADLASRLRDVRLQRKIIKEIITRIGGSKTLTDLTTNFHALNNAGKAVQVEILQMFLSDKRVPDSIKVLIIENLKKRLHDETGVDEMVHSILGSTGYSPLVKASVINAQSERERHLKRGTSIKHVARLHRKTKNEEIRTAVKNYLYVAGSQEAGDELAKAMKLKPKKQRRSPSSIHHGIVGRSLLSNEDLELLGNFESLEETHVLFFRRFFRRIGNAVRRIGGHIRNAARRIGGHIRNAARRIGGHLRRIASRIGSVAKRIGAGIVRIAKTVAKGVVAAVKWIADKVMAAINAVKAVVEKIKYYFGGAKFENQQACMQMSTDSKDQMCLYNQGMIDFVRKQGDLSNIKKAKHFSFEKLLGTNAVHAYLGFLVYAGASFECSAEKSGFDFVLMAKANMYAKLFKKEFVVIDASGELSKRPEQPVNDNIFVKVFSTTFINKQFVPDRIRKVLEACFSETKPLVEKRFPKLIDLNYQFSIGPVPVTFNFNVALNMGVELRYGVCVEKLEASVSVEPYISLSITGSANVGVPVAKVGIYLKATITYRIVPRLAFERCNLCAMLQHKVDGVQFHVGLTASFMKWSKEWKFFGTQTAPYVKTLFEKCIGAGGYKPSDNDSKKFEFSTSKSKPAEQAPEQGAAPQQPAAAEQGAPEQPANPSDPPTNPPGYVAPPPEVIGHPKVDTPEELAKIAKEKGLGEWAQKTSAYKPLFGPKAERIPVNGGDIVPPKPGRQTLKMPVTTQEEKVWSNEFLKEHVPEEVLTKMGPEKLRHLPIEYFHLKMEDRAKIPMTMLDLPTNDLKHFIEHLPNRYEKTTQLVIPKYAYTKVWSQEILAKRLPKQVMQNVPVEFLRHLPEEVLQVRIRVLSQVPIPVWKQGPKAVITWICGKYKRLCARLVKAIKADTGTDISSEISQPQQPATPAEQPQQQPQTAPAEQPQQNQSQAAPARGRGRRGGRNSRRGGSRGGFGNIHLDINVNVNKAKADVQIPKQ